MRSSPFVLHAAGQRLTLLHSLDDCMVSAVASTPPVWGRKEAMPKLQTNSENELVNLYAEEMYIAELTLNENDARTTKDMVASNYDSTSLCFSTQGKSSMIEIRPELVPLSVYNGQQACRPYPTPTTLLYDIAVPAESDNDLALLAPFSPEEMPRLFMRPTKQAMEYFPTPDLLDSSDLKLQPTGATDPLSDTIFQMLDINLYNDEIIQETVSEYASMHRSHALICSSPILGEAELDELATDELFKPDERGVHSKYKLKGVDSRERPHEWEIGYDGVYGGVNAYTFLPGVEHLTNVEARSMFLTYDKDIEALQKATAEFLDDRYDGGYSSLSDKVGSAGLPDDNLLLASNDTTLGLSVQYPTADSLLSLIDEIVNSETLFEDVADLSSAQSILQEECSCLDQNSTYLPCHNSPHIAGASPLIVYNIAWSDKINHAALTQLDGPFSFEQTSRLSAASDPARLQCTNLTVLNQPSSHYNKTSDIVGAQSNTVNRVSEISVDDADEIDDLSMSQPPELTYSDADTQQPIVYTAFHQLLMGLDNDDILPRIHRADHDFDNDSFDLVGGVREIDELPSSDNVIGPESSSMQEEDFETFHVGLHDAQYQSAPVRATVAKLRSIDSLHSYSFFKCHNSKKRMQLKVNTQLDDIVEVSSDEERAPLSSSSSEDSICFAEQWGFVRTLPARRADFLDDEDSVNGLEGLQTLGSPETPSFASAPASPIVDCPWVLFNDPIWHSQPDLHFSFPHTPLYPTLPSAADLVYDSDILNTLETELVQLISYIFDCLHGYRFTEARALGVNLQWALNDLATTFPKINLMERCAHMLSFSDSEQQP
jgi:hypothetical protein